MKEQSNLWLNNKKYKQFYDYSIFTEQEFLEAWLGAKVYDFICSTAWTLKQSSIYPYDH